MFPLRDDNPTLLTPYVTVVLILANVVVWLYVQGAGYSSCRGSLRPCFENDSALWIS